MNRVHLVISVFKGVLSKVEVHTFAATAQARVREWRDKGPKDLDVDYLVREILYPQESVSVLNLPPKYERRLHRNGIHTLGQLCVLTRKRLYALNYIGHGCCGAVEEALAARGLALATEESKITLPPDAPRPTCKCEGKPQMFCILDAPTGRLWECESCGRGFYVSKVSNVKRWFRYE